MTREEAIKLLIQYIDYDVETPDYYKMEEACKVAIKALEQEPKTDTWSIKEVADALEKHGLRMSEISETEIKSMTKEQNYMHGYEDGKSDVLDKVRAEILDACGYSKDYVGAFDYSTISLKLVLQIIDKYKAESEVPT